MAHPQKNEKPHKEILETRVVRLETAFQYLATKPDLSDVRTDLKEEIANVRTDLMQEIANVRMELKEEMSLLERRLIHRMDIRFERVEVRIERDFRILFGALIGSVLALAGLMAKGFHWF